MFIKSSTNRLLSALPPADHYRIVSKSEQFTLNFADQIYGADDLIDYVYFPTAGVVSLLSAVENTFSLEVGLVGREGLVGLPVFLGVERSRNLAIVQGEGEAIRMRADIFIEECAASDALSARVRRYAHSRMTQISQSAVCLGYHTAEQRLSRWLLMTADRMRSDEFEITQAFMSSMLGIRREAVNKAVKALESRELIRHTRGRISITDREQLERQACFCYSAIVEEEQQAARLN